MTTTPCTARSSALAALSAAGVVVYFMHGNRDFLCGTDFAARTGVRLLGDYAVLDLDGQRTVVTHGDLLCTRDVSTSLPARGAPSPGTPYLPRTPSPGDAASPTARERTLVSTGRKAAHIMDVEPATVSAVLREHGASLLIHVTRTARVGTRSQWDGRACTRIVLGDWYEQDQVSTAATAWQRACWSRNSGALKRCSDFWAWRAAGRGPRARSSNSDTLRADRSAQRALVKSSIVAVFSTFPVRVSTSNNLPSTAWQLK